MKLLLSLSAILFSFSLIAQDYPSALADRECIELDLSESVQVENSHFIYRWDFGDGTVNYGVIASHCYDSLGTFRTSLSIQDPISGTEFEEEYAQTIQIVPAVELMIELDKQSEVYNLKAMLDGEGISNTSFFWTVNDQYFVSNQLTDLPLEDGDNVRVLAKFNFQGEETLLAKQITIGSINQ